LYSELRVALGMSAATIAGHLARDGYILRRRYSLAGQSGRVSEYLHATLTWPDLPAGAWGTLYDHGEPKAREER
jgi:hypothetical protein